MTNKYSINVNGERIELHDIDKYQSAKGDLRVIKEGLSACEKNDVNFPAEVKKILGKTIEVVLNIAKEIYDPIIDKQKQEKALSKPNDYKTDFESLDELPEIFE